MSRRLFAFLLGLTVIVVPASAAAKVGAILPDCVNDGNCGLDDFVEMFSNAYGWGLSILGALALFFFVYGGFTWLIAAGNQERIERGKKILENTLIGVVIGLTSWMIVNVVIAFLVTPPGETVDFTGTRVLGRPWWNFWASEPSGCCLDASGCTENLRETRCKGPWFEKKSCAEVRVDGVAICSQGCCVPTDLAANSCVDTSNGGCPQDYQYFSGKKCADTPSCKGCCIKVTVDGNVCRNEQNSSECNSFIPGPCSDVIARLYCPSDLERGCCEVGPSNCINDLAKYECAPYKIQPGPCSGDPNCT